MQNFKSEANEIIERYKRRGKKDKANFYNITTPSCMINSLEKENHTIRILAKNFGCDFINKKFLEVGCGTGTNLCNLISWGVNPENLFGNDIFEPSLQTARQRLPQTVTLQQGNFLDCSYDNQSFDVILFSTVLSSILDEDFQIECLKRSYNLLKPNGIVLLYDFQFDNPWNKDLKGINLKKLKQAVPWSRSVFSRVTLCPPLARKLENLPALIRILTACKVLNTHVIGFFKK